MLGVYFLSNDALRILLTLGSEAHTHLPSDSGPMQVSERPDIPNFPLGTLSYHRRNVFSS
jgi:hypothetical protein